MRVEGLNTRFEGVGAAELQLIIQKVVRLWWGRVSPTLQHKAHLYWASNQIQILRWPLGGERI